MFDFLKKQQKPGEIVHLRIGGMHCPSCSMNIDGALEELEGVVEAKTSYSKAITEVRYRCEQVKRQKLISVIQSLGYEVKQA